MVKSRPRPKRSRQPKLVQQLTRAAQLWTLADSYYEEQYWEMQINRIVDTMLSKNCEHEIERAVETLFPAQMDAGTLIMQTALHLTQFTRIKNAEKTWDCLLMSAPVLAWSRYHVPSLEPTEQVTKHILEGLRKFILAPDTGIRLMPRPLSPMELPASLSETAKWVKTLSSTIFDKNKRLPEPHPMADNFSFLADNRHWVFVAYNEVDKPILRWMADPSLSKDDCLQQWREHVAVVLPEVFMGCQTEVLLPDAYNNAYEAGNHAIRKIGVCATIEWLETALGTPARNLQATVMAFGDHDIREYRIGYSFEGETTVVYGNIWPVFDDPDETDYLDTLLDLEDTDETEDFDDLIELDDLETMDDLIDLEQLDEIASMSDLDQIIEALTASGIENMKFIPGLEPLEYCDECSAPFFPNLDGDIVHPEMPDDVFDTPSHFH